MKHKTDEYQTIRIWQRTQRRLKLLSALTGESIVQVIDRLTEQEEQRLEQEKKEHGKINR